MRLPARSAIQADAQPLQPDVQPPRLPEPEGPGRVDGVQSGLGEKGVARG